MGKGMGIRNGKRTEKGVGRGMCPGRVSGGVRGQGCGGPAPTFAVPLGLVHWFVFFP